MQGRLRAAPRAADLSRAITLSLSSVLDAMHDLPDCLRFDLDARYHDPYRTVEDRSVSRGTFHGHAFESALVHATAAMEAMRGEHTVREEIEAFALPFVVASWVWQQHDCVLLVGNEGPMLLECPRDP